MPFINQMTKQTSNTKNIYVHKMYKMIYKTLKMTKQTSNTKTYVQDDMQNIKNDETN